MTEDDALVRKARGGDRNALEAVWRAHRRFVAAVLFARWPRGLDLEDGLQEVALALVRRIGSLEDPGKLRPWLRAIAIRAAATAGRRLEIEVRGSASAEVEPAVPGDARLVDARDEESVVLARVRELPLDYREPLVLRAVHGMTQREIASALGLPETTVETRLARARRMLREAMTIRAAAPRAQETKR